MTPAIKIEGISKQYRIGVAGRGGYRTLRESVSDSAAGTWRRLTRLGRRKSTAAAANGHATDSHSTNGHSTNVLGAPLTQDKPNSFWALKDVSFDVQPGEVVGIIGRNGAGKSTLLKILSRITEPTKGRIVLNGRVASLLEVGTGFHPELTGRENIYMNGSILGMRHSEIVRKFDQIVDFAEVSNFLDTPVKRYSSGMYVRLAFSVAAHLDPEILIVDEVLAVGDASFQRKCISRMSEIAGGGRTVLFVSHNMEVIPRLCRSAVLMSYGRIADMGPATEVVHTYLKSEDNVLDGDLSLRPRSGLGTATFVKLDLFDQFRNRIIVHRSGDNLTIRTHIKASKALKDAAVAISLRNRSGASIVSSWTREQSFPISLTSGCNLVECTFQHLRWRPGHPIVISLWLEHGGNAIDHVQDAITINVDPTEDTMHLSTDGAQGSFICNSKWNISGS